MRHSSAVGAYTEALLQGGRAVRRCSIASAALFSAAVGIIVGLPALRLKGIYLAIATLAFNVIVEEIVTRWESLTGGNSGMLLKPIEMFGYKLSSRSELLLPLPRAVSCRARADQPVALADRPRLRGDPRLGESRRAAWASTCALQDHVVRALRARSPASAARSMRTRSLHLARAVHPDPVDRARHHRDHRRRRLAAWRGPGQRRSSSCCRRASRSPRAGARYDPAGRAAIDRVRPDPDRVHHLRALRPLRPLAEDPHLRFDRRSRSTGAACSSASASVPRRRSGCDEGGGRGGGRRASRGGKSRRAVRRRGRGRRRELRGRAGRGLHHHRAERRRQDHDLQPDRPDLPADLGPHPVRRTRADRPRRHRRRARHRAHVPEHRAVRARDRAAEPADRPPPPSLHQSVQEVLFLPSRAAPRSRSARRSSA